MKKTKQQKRSREQALRLPSIVFVLGEKRVPKLERHPNTIVKYLPPKWTAKQRWRLARELGKRQGSIWDYAQRDGGPGAPETICETWNVGPAVLEELL
jgi:hypothetical protein